VRWQNAASRELVGDLRGRLDASVLAPSDLARARDAYARKQDGAPSAELEASVSRTDGSRVRVAVNSVPLRDRDGEMIGSFGLVQVLDGSEPLAEGAPLGAGRGGGTGAGGFRQLRITDRPWKATGEREDR